MWEFTLAMYIGFQNATLLSDFLVLSASFAPCLLLGNRPPTCGAQDPIIKMLPDIAFSCSFFTLQVFLAHFPCSYSHFISSHDLPLL